MTTVAYDHEGKTIAVDSRFTRGDMISTDNGNKIIKRDGVTFVLAGQSAMYPDLVDMWFGGDVKEELACSALVVSKGKVYHYGLDGDRDISSELIEENFTMGSGATWALSSMDHGKSAKDAVKYAMTRDVYTGGKIRLIKVK